MSAVNGRGVSGDGDSSGALRSKPTEHDAVQAQRPPPAGAASDDAYVFPAIVDRGSADAALIFSSSLEYSTGETPRHHLVSSRAKFSDDTPDGGQGVGLVGEDALKLSLEQVPSCCEGRRLRAADDQGERCGSRAHLSYTPIARNTMVFCR
jgi:hypothetical protein